MVAYLECQVCICRIRHALHVIQHAGTWLGSGKVGSGIGEGALPADRLLAVVPLLAVVGVCDAQPDGHGAAPGCDQESRGEAACRVQKWQLDRLHSSLASGRCVHQRRHANRQVARGQAPLACGSCAGAAIAGAGLGLGRTAHAHCGVAEAALRGRIDARIAAALHAGGGAECEACTAGRTGGAALLWTGGGLPTGWRQLTCQ